MQNYDVVIIGGGVVGSAIARELSRYQLKTAVLEKNLDVCNETSGRNTGVCHGGFAYDPGSLKARFCVEGNRKMSQLSEELHFTFHRTGKVLVGFTEEEHQRLLEVKAQGEKNGVTTLRFVNKEELHELVPSVEGEFALFSESSGVLDPFMYTIALAENAVMNGVHYYLDNEVISVDHEEGGLRTIRTKHALPTNQSPTEYSTRWIINAAGLACAQISDMLGLPGNRIIYSKDDYILLDERMGKLVPMPIYTVPSNTYMGIHVSITSDGNVLLGPTAQDEESFRGYAVEQKNLDYLFREANKIWKHVSRADYIRTYSGVLPKLVDANGKIQDFKIEFPDQEAPKTVNLIGIESPGLTAASAIADYIIEEMKAREELPANPDFNPCRIGITRLASLPEEKQARLISEDPNYGELICRCQKVTKAEILQAIRNPLGVATMTGIKYRTRSMMGRCQGGYCQMRIAEMLEKEHGLKPAELNYSGAASPLFFGALR